ncbi:unnamed protein product [Toxocara canis]|uniref:Trehalase n=1 Tax=Toxocara canis TaxID=6265 RepID=A0A183VCI4_TOXCA|nr:unnamed protein product [Toxocara canis]
MKAIQSPSSNIAPIQNDPTEPSIDLGHQSDVVLDPSTMPFPESVRSEALEPFLNNQNSTVLAPLGQADTFALELDHPTAVSGPVAIQLHYLRRWPSSWHNRIIGKIAEDNQIPSQTDVISSTFEDPEFACDISDSRNAIVFCQGELLHAVMMLHLFDDSKTFVDKPLKMDPDLIVARFKERFPHTLTTQHRDAIRAFVDEHFDVEGNELEECDPIDWDEQPKKLLTIDDPVLREFALKINSIWKKLCRTVKKEVAEQPERFSFLYVPNEFVIPGGRFREFYYWDTYWVVKGLLASGMHETTKRMIANFKHLIERNGFIPNGGRIYYMRRSQPPMFIPMVYEYHTVTKDDQFLYSAIEAMEKEMDFWKTKRTVNISKNNRNFTVFRYRADSNVPRPESYREDYETAEKVSIERKRRLWRDIASAAESGWDFSSRWMADGQTMHTIETSDIAPVDLNAFMCWNMAILAHLHGRLGNHTRRAELFRERNEFVDTFTEVFFDGREGVWFDVRVQTGEWAQDAYPSVAAPLFTECYHRLDERMMMDVLDTLERYGFLGFPGGIPTRFVFF